MSQRVLITGGAGFIGSHLAEAFLRRGDAVAILDSFSDLYDPRIKRRNASDVCTAGGELFEADFCDQAAVAAVLDRFHPDVIIHLGACAGVIPSVRDPVLYATTNVVGTTVMLDAAVRAGVKRFILASSSSVYGNNRKVPFAEDDPVEEPISPYAATKRSCELLAHAFSHLHDLPVTALRFFTVFGPRQRPDLAIHLFMRKIARGEPITMYGDGSTSRDYTFIDDIIRGVLAALDDCGRHGAFRVYNLGGNQPVRLDDLIAAIETTLDREAAIVREPQRAGDVDRTYADLTRSRAELGFEPGTCLRDGLAAQWTWMQQAGVLA
ncbi:MAG: GDP-mannose 4,6-dehydratase [Phycisphaerales bacterium]|nr:GDP-mannose 4,6-dehydratase [Phycisphaerales bacterium]